MLYAHVIRQAARARRQNSTFHDPRGQVGACLNTKPTHRSSEGNSLSLVSGYVCNFGDLYSGHIADAAVLCSCCEAGVAGLAVVVFISGGRPKLASDTHPASRTSEHA